MSTATHLYRCESIHPAAGRPRINQGRATATAATYTVAARATRDHLRAWRASFAVLLAGAALLVFVLGLSAIPTAAHRIDAPLPSPSSQLAPPPPPDSGAHA
jgi:hypothetical protein